MRKLYLPILLGVICLVYTIPSMAATIYSEDFTGQNGKGAIGPNPPTIDVSGVSWNVDISGATLSASTDWFRVVSEVFEGRDLDGNAIWLSPSINISAHTNISISIDLSESGNHETSDYINSEYRIDGGAWTTFATNGNVIDDFNSAVAAQTGLNGSTLEIRVSMQNNAGSEYLRIDNILVDGTPATSSPEIQIEEEFGNNQPCGFTNDFGSLTTGTSLDDTMRISNIGTAVLNITTPLNISGPDNSHFSIVTNPSATVGASSSSDLIVQFNPSTDGAKTAFIDIVNDDSDENPCRINLSGTAVPLCVAPSAQPTVLTFPGITSSMIDGSFTASSPVADEYLVVISTSSTLGANPSDGTTYAPGNTIGAGTVVQSSSSTSFSATGLTSSTTYYFFVFAFNDVGCTGGPVYNTTSPLVDMETTIAGPCVTESFANIPSGSSTSYLTRNWTGDAGGTWTATDARTDQSINGSAILIRNGTLTSPTFSGGISSITLTTQRVFSGGTGTLDIQINGSSVGTVPYDATVQTTTISGINISGNIDLVVGSPSGSGDRVAIDDLEIFCFNGPEIQLQQPLATDQVCGFTYDFGNQSIGSNTDDTIWIKNLSTADLNITTPLSVTGTNASEFSIVAQPAAIVPGGDSTFVIIRFSPTSSGGKSAAIDITNDDSDESPCTINLTGISDAPDIQLQQPILTNQACGYTYDYGLQTTGSNTDVTVRIQNDGSAALNLTVPLSIAGPDASEFSIQTQPSGTLAASANSDMVIRFSPSTAGTKTAYIDIVSNDLDELPCRINLDAEAQAPCATPGAQPLNLNFTSVTFSQVDGSFAAPTPAADGYLVVMSTASSLSGNPVDGTTYIAGDPLGGGTVIQAGSSTVFSATGLSQTTTYYFFVFSYNDISCVGAPVYLTASPLSGSTTTPAAPVCVIFDDFNRANSTTVGNGWSEVGGDEEVSGNQLIFMESSSTSGRDYIYRDASSSYSTVLSSLTTAITWEFNMRHTRSNPSGFGLGNYGAAFVLGGTTSDITTGNGYAVVHGEGGTTDNVRLVRYSAGVSGTLTDVITGSADLGSEHLSIRVTYDPNTDTWELFVRDDGASFADPSTLNAGNSEGTAVNTTYVGSDLRYIAAVWNHNTSGTELAEFDNICIENIPTPEIEVAGNGKVIDDGDITPETPDGTDFGIVETISGSVAQTFAIRNGGGDDLDLTDPSPYVTITPNTHFTLTANPSTPVLAGDSSLFTVTFDPTVNGVHTATVSIANSDSDENPYTFDITGEGSNSNLSDIVEDGTFSYPENIDYTLDQGDPITNTSISIGVMRFIIRDGGAAAGDLDVVGTELTDITFTVVNLDNIRSAAIFDGNAMIANNPVINVGAGTITFSGMSDPALIAPDDGTKSLTLRVSFLTAVTDNEQLEFTVTSATANSTGSIFAASDAGGAVSSTAGDDNRIEVTASALEFVQQPSTTSTNATMTPAVTVQGIDVNDNIDLDWSGTVSITSDGTMTGDPISVTTSGGIATFNSIVHTAAGTGLIITASHSTFTDVDSDPFDIIDFVFAAGDFRPLYATDFSFNGDWEYFDGISWGAVPDGRAPQNTVVTINRILIDEYVTGGGSSSNNYDCDILILPNGTLDIVDVDAPPVASEFLSAGNTLEVYDLGTLRIEGDIDLPASANLILRDGAEMIIDNFNMVNDHPMWEGVENFEEHSTLTITDWDWTASATVKSLINVTSAITSNANGYKFGNLTLDAAPSDDWTFVGGGIVVNVAEGDVIVNNTGSNNVQVMTNRSANISATFGGNFYVNDGAFSFSGTYNNDDFNHTITVLGDFENTSDDAMYLHRNNVNTPNSINSEVHIEGDFTVDGPTILSSDLASSSTNYEVYFDGPDSQFVKVTPDISEVAFIVESGSFALLKDENLKFTGNTTWETKGGATMNFNFDVANNPLYIDGVSGGGNEFNHRTGAYVYITDPGGLWTTNSAIGNVRNIPTANSSIGNTNSTFHYIGKTDQQTGDCHTSGSTSKKVIVELEVNSDELTLTSSTGTSDELRILSGVFVETEAANIDGSGVLNMTGGGFRSSVLTTTGIVPQLTGNYTLTAGFVELNAAGDQTLRGSVPVTRPNYFDLIISGSNISGTNDKTVTSSITVNNRVTITGTPIFDLSNNSMEGTAGLTMDGGLLRMARLNTSLPELDGTVTAYNITDGTIEWYGSGSTQNQLIRGVDANLNTITYHNIEVNAAAANTATANVDLAEGIVIEGVMNINSPAVFQMDNTDHVDGTGSFYVRSGATYKYGDEYGITFGTSTALSAGAIRTSSNRTAANFSSDASYGWVSSGDMVTGNALPATIVNAYLQKNNTSDDVTMLQDLEVRNTLDMDRGNILTDAYLLYLGEDDVNTGTLAYDITFEPFVVGGMVRWFDNGTNSGDASGLFPLGVRQPASENIYNRFLLMEYATAKSSGGTLAVAFFEVRMGLNGLPLGIAGAGSCAPFTAVSTEEDGYWAVFDGDGISGGTYNIRATGEGFNTITDLCQITLLKRVGTSPWFQDGVHQEPTLFNGHPTVARHGGSGFSNFGFAGGELNPLPVELVEFEAEKWGEDVLLTWTTASEIDNDFFELQHSIDGSNFTAIGQVEGQGTTAIPHDYSHIHEDPILGLNYYRLRIVDFDGGAEFSDIRTVLFDVREDLEVINTMAGDVIEVIVPNTGRAGVLTVYAMNGQVVRQKQMTPDGIESIRLNVADLPSAMYAIQWYDGIRPIEKKFIKY